MSADDQRVANEDNVQTIVVDPAGLKRVGARSGPLRYLKEIWDYRSFIVFDSKSQISGGASSDELGKIWLVLNPILNAATYYLVFGVLLGTSRGIENFVAYLILGVFMFRYTSSTILAGSKSISGNKSVLRAFTFPRATLPISVNVREIMVQVPAFITMFILILLIPPLEPLTWKWLLFIPLVAVQFLFNLGLSLILARVVTRWNDLTHVITFGTRLWLYLSCVFFSPERFDHIEPLVTAMHLNPMFCVLDIARDLILYDAWPAPERWIVLGAWTVLALIIGYIVFWQAEETYGREK